VDADPPVVEVDAGVRKGRPADERQGEEQNSQSEKDPTARHQGTRHTKTRAPRRSRAGVPEASVGAYWKYPVTSRTACTVPPTAATRV
jgi:hypothetical protein